MKKSQLQSIIREELKSTLNEGATEKKIADLYAYAGIRTNYDDRMVQRYGNSIVAKAIELAPKVLEFQKKLKAIAKEFKTTPEAQILFAMAQAKKGYAGDQTPASMGDVFNLEEAIGKGLEVVQDGDKYEQPTGDDPYAFGVDYIVKLNGKQIGDLTFGSYFGDIKGDLYGRPLPDIGEWEPIGVDKNKMFDDEGDKTPEYIKGKLLGFLKSNTGMKWLSVLKKKTPDAFAGM